MKSSNFFLTARNTMAALALATVIGCTGGADKGATPESKPAETTTEGTAAAASRPASTSVGNQVSDVIKIGLVASENGELKPWGQDCVSGAKLAEDEINATGGIEGKKVQILVGDSSSKPEQGKSAAEKLITDGAVVIVGEVASGITAQIEKAAFSKGIPVVAVGATRTDLAAEGNNFFRVCYIDDFQGPVMANFAYNELGLRKMAVLTDNKQTYSQYLSKTFAEKFKALGGEIVAEQSYEGAQSQYNGQLTEIKSKGPDGIFCSGYFSEVGPIARQARELGLTKESVKLLGGDGWDSTEIVNSAGDAIVGGYFCNHYNNEEDRAEVKDFLKQWQAKYKTLPGTTMGALGYDATRLAIDAVKRAFASAKGQPVNSKLVIDALENTENFKGVSGSITLKGQGGNPPKRALVVEIQADGKQKFRKAYEYAEIMNAKK